MEGRPVGAGGAIPGPPPTLSAPVPGFNAEREYAQKTGIWTARASGDRAEPGAQEGLGAPAGPAGGAVPGPGPSTGFTIAIFSI